MLEGLGLGVQGLGVRFEDLVLRVQRLPSPLTSRTKA